MNRDISSEMHAQLDARMGQSLAAIPGDVPDPSVLFFLLGNCTAAYADLWPIDQEWDFSACSHLLASRSDIRALLETARATGRYARIRSLRM